MLKNKTKCNFHKFHQPVHRYRPAEE